MRAKLTVLGGSNKGKNILIAKAQFVLGRDESCNLRLKHESISRKHCAFAIHPDKITIRDLGSRNGTLLNGVRLTNETEIKTGDRIQFGPLDFSVQLIDQHGNPIEAASASASGPAKIGDSGLISDWLSDTGNDTVASNKTTRLFKFDPDESNEADDSTKTIKNVDTKALKASKDKKKKPQKLPSEPVDIGEDSSEAAADTLRRLFNRGT
jgi:pSer/pThr/pTyr-binding forkhead associated (FHA) protein